MRISQNKTKELKGIYTYLKNIKVFNNDGEEEAEAFVYIKRLLMIAILDLLNFDSKVDGNYPYKDQFFWEENTREIDYKQFFTENK